ncbi:MAG: IS3 family transposase [Bacteroidales bacterium]|nr:IS3 family transposase [Bacteroidales bacterium]
MISVEKVRSAGFSSISDVCSCFDLKRDAYYKYQKRFLKRELLKDQVLSLVKERRKELPREGCRKLHTALHDKFVEQDLKVGRDALFDILREKNMLVMRKRSFTKTTNSYHHFHKYRNLIYGITPTRKNQIWVSDITYIRTVNGFCYLALITDVFSRKIVGYDISDSLELAGCLRALKKALRRAGKIKDLIHHSDRGVQYCSHQYVNKLKKRKIKISMTEENHCYENAIAERVNGILKDEFFLDQTFFSVVHAQRATKNAIDLYNNKRLHLSLKYKTPNMLYKNVA